jgi:hypothetical protein
MDDSDFEKSNALENILAAHELREQMQGKYNEDEIIDDEFDNKLKEHYKSIFKFSSEEEIDEMMKHCVIPQLYTKHDSPLTYHLINTYESMILESLKILGYDMLDGVSLGMINKEGLTAEQTKVMMTDASIVNISDYLILTIHRYTKLLAKSFAITNIGEGIFVIDMELQSSIDQKLSNTELQYEWDMFFEDHALSLKRPSKGEKVSLNSLEELTLQEAFSTCMSLFVLGHEYGHHVMKHSSNGEVFSGNHKEEENKISEYEADLVAFEISAVASCLEENNEVKYYLYANLGPLLVFTMFDYIKMANSILLTGDVSYDVHTENAHPSGPNRYNAFIDFIGSQYRHEDIPAIKKLHVAITDLTDYIWANSKLHIKSMFDNGILPRDNESGWLP